MHGGFLKTSLLIWGGTGPVEVRNIHLSTSTSAFVLVNACLCLCLPLSPPWGFGHYTYYIVSIPSFWEALLNPVPTPVTLLGWFSLRIKNNSLICNTASP